MWAGLGARRVCCADKRHAARMQAEKLERVSSGVLQWSRSLCLPPGLSVKHEVWVVSGWWWVWHGWDHGCSGGSGGFDQGEGRTRSMESCTTFRFFEAELPGSSGAQHSLYSKVLPGKEYPQDVKSDWIKSWMRLYLIQCQEYVLCCNM